LIHPLGNIDGTNGRNPIEQWNVDTTHLPVKILSPLQNTGSFPNSGANDYNLSYVLPAAIDIITGMEGYLSPIN